MTKSVVALVECTNYDRNRVGAAVRRGIELLGGAPRFAARGERITLKPNVLSGTDPAKCVTTHPEVLRAVAAAFSGTGASLWYGDSSGLLSTSYNMRRARYTEVADELSLQMADFDSGQVVQHSKALIAHRLVLANGVLASDGLIGLPKCKTHNLVRYTGAIKNQFGCVPGMAKGRYHAQYPDVYDFCRLLVDLNTYIKPRLYVMDAVMAMEGDGPRSGDPKNLGLLILSTDPVALDAVMCKIISLPSEHVPTLALGEEGGLGVADLSNVELCGDSLERFLDPSFRVIRRPPVRMSGGPVRRAIKNMMAPRPVVERSACTQCGNCVDICPVEPKAVFFGPKGGDRPPVHNYSACIRCFCCNEVCPARAIRAKTPLIGRALPFASYLSLLINRTISRSHRP